MISRHISSNCAVRCPEIGVESCLINGFVSPFISIRFCELPPKLPPDKSGLAKGAIAHPCIVRRSQRKSPDRAGAFDTSCEWCCPASPMTTSLPPWRPCHQPIRRRDSRGMGVFSLNAWAWTIGCLRFVVSANSYNGPGVTGRANNKVCFRPEADIHRHVRCIWNSPNDLFVAADQSTLRGNLVILQLVDHAYHLAIRRGLRCSHTDDTIG